MTINFLLPILFPSRASELPVKVSVVNGNIKTVFANVDSYELPFSKDASGKFVAKTVADIDSLFVNHIEIQLNRVFG